jgi:ABC-type Zn uptake system ZnuABC Zn-binding protein ZnuA
LTCILVVIAAATAWTAPLLPEKTASVEVLTTLPVTQYIAATLSAGTSVTARFVGPEAGTLADHARHLETSEAFARAAKRADAVVTVGGSWPADPLYPAARAVNIRIVEIDAVAPIEPGRVGVGTRAMPGADAGDVPVPYVWTSPASVGKMADVVAADLMRLAPGSTARIEKNLADLKAGVFAMRTAAQDKLLDVEVAEVVSLSPASLYLCQDLGIHVAAWYLEDPFRWNDADREEFLQTVKRLEVPTVIAPFPLSEDLTTAIEANGVSLVVIDSLARPGKDIGTAPGAFMDALAENVKRLTSALAGD